MSIRMYFETHYTAGHRCAGSLQLAERPTCLGFAVCPGCSDVRSTATLAELVEYAERDRADALRALGDAEMDLATLQWAADAEASK
jgi:hypothetical protein